MKDFMAAVAGVFGKRYTARQKARFVAYIQNREEKKGIPVRIQEGQGRGKSRCRNVYIGNVKNAAVILAVPYDTLPGRLLPVWRYYPVRADKNLKTDTVVMIFHILTAVVLTVGYFRFLQQLREMGKLGGIGMLVLLFPMVWIAVKLLSGWGNKNNISRNSASIVTALEFLDRYPKEAAVVLLDQSSCGFWGYKCLKEDLKEKAAVKNVIALDCISSGDALFCYENEKGKLSLQDGEVIQKQATQTEKEQSILGLFERGVLLTGGRVGLEPEIRDTGCSRDKEINLEKMEKAIQVLHEVCTGLR